MTGQRQTDTHSPCLICSSADSVAARQPLSTATDLKLIQFYWSTLDIDTKLLPDFDPKRYSLCVGCYQLIKDFYNTNHKLVQLEQRVKVLYERVMQNTLNGIKQLTIKNGNKHKQSEPDRPLSVIQEQIIKRWQWQHDQNTCEMSSSTSQEGSFASRSAQIESDGGNDKSTSGHTADTATPSEDQIPRVSSTKNCPCKKGKTWHQRHKHGIKQCKWCFQIFQTPKALKAHYPRHWARPHRQESNSTSSQDINQLPMVQRSPPPSVKYTKDGVRRSPRTTRRESGSIYNLRIHKPNLGVND